MSRDIKDLDPVFAKQVKILVANCALRGITVVPYLTYRSPEEQAKLWRQGRKIATIKTKIKELRQLGCDYLADCIENAGPQSGDKVTNAIPGKSWHQFGLACDFYWEKSKGNACWSHNTLDENGLNGYKVLHEEAHKLGLTSITLNNGGSIDWPHIQAPEQGAPSQSLKEINDLLANK